MAAVEGVRDALPAGEGLAVPEPLWLAVEAGLGEGVREDRAEALPAGDSVGVPVMLGTSTVGDTLALLLRVLEEEGQGESEGVREPVVESEAASGVLRATSWKLPSNRPAPRR